MASQQGAPTRPWFRLATMVRPPPSATPAAPTPQPDQGPPPPRPAFIRPAFGQTFRAPPAAPPPQPTATPPDAPPPVPAANVVAPPSPPTPPPARPSPPQPQVAKATPAPASSPTVPKEPRPTPSPRSSAPRTPPLQQSGPPSAVATSPPPPPPSRPVAPSLTATMAPTTTHAATPTSSPPKTIKPPEKTPPPSPTIKPISRPPSPLTLPSPQLKSHNGHQPEYQQKTVLVQETKEKPKGLDNGVNGDLRRHMGWGAHDPKGDATKKPETSKKHSDSEDFGMRIITIAGENKGAIMDLSPFGNKTHKLGNIPHSLHTKKDTLTASSDGEKSGTDSDGRSKAKNKNHKSKSPLMAAVMNSNVQGVNNSILYNCSTTHHDPGVHLSLSRKPNGGRGSYLKDHKDNIN